MKERSAVDFHDGQRDELPASSRMTIVTMVDGDEAQAEDDDDDDQLDRGYLEIDPNEIENIRDMTTTMDRKKSVR